jgi:hypothetical protein
LSKENAAPQPWQAVAQRLSSIGRYMVKQIEVCQVLQKSGILKEWPLMNTFASQGFMSEFSPFYAYSARKTSL